MNNIINTDKTDTDTNGNRNDTYETIIIENKHSNIVEKQ